MKKMNLVFSGFLASLLLGGGNVNAATSGDPVKIASQKYVDENYAKQETVNQITENVTTVKQQVEQITDPETGLAADVEQLQTDVAGKASAESVATLEGTVTSQGGRLTTAEGEIDALQTASATHATTTALTEGLALKENVANKATTIGADNQSSPTVYPSVGAIVEWTNKKIADLSDTGLPVNPDNINDNSIARI